MLTSIIQKDLLDFIRYDEEDRKGLIQFWYIANSNALSAALTQTDNLRLMFNISNFQKFEELSKKLFLMADTLILRDNRLLSDIEVKPDCIPFIKDYIPSYLPEIEQELCQLKPSPFTLQYCPSAYWSSTSKKLNNGLIADYALDITNIPIPDEFVDWISTKGDKYLSTGNIIYAPFIPPVEFELDLLRHKVSLPDTFQALSLFCEDNISLQSSAITALLSLNIPTLDNIDIQTINKIKQDNNDLYTEFSSSLLDALTTIKSIEGTANFKNEVAYIQKHLINDNLDKTMQATNALKSSAALRRMGLVISALGVTISLLEPNFAPIYAVSGLAPGLVDMIIDMKQKSLIKESQSSFLLKLQNK